MGDVRRVASVGWVLLTGCRLGFEGTPPGGDDAARTDGAAQADARAVDAGADDPDGGEDDPDAGAADARPPDAATGLLYWSYGEDSAADRRLVTRDTYLSSEPAELGFNFGDDNRLRIARDDDQNGLVAFDVAGGPVPAGTVVGLRLELFVIAASAGASVEVREQVQPWTEGAFDGAAGAANWIQATDSTSWTSPGAAPASVALGSLDGSQLGRVGIDLPPSLFDRWRTGANHGLWLHLVAGTEVRAGSREGIDGQRPRLVLIVQP